MRVSYRIIPPSETSSHPRKCRRPRLVNAEQRGEPQHVGAEGVAVAAVLVERQGGLLEPAMRKIVIIIMIMILTTIILHSYLNKQIHVII